MRRLLISSIACFALMAVGVSPAVASEWTQLWYDAAQSGVNSEDVGPGSIYNIGNTTPTWERRPPTRSKYTTAPIVTEQAIIVGGSLRRLDGSKRAMLWSYDLDDGSLNWKRMLACETVKAPSLALGHGMIVAVQRPCYGLININGDSTDALTLVDLESGEVRKTFRYVDEIQDLISPPTVDGRTVVFETNLNGESIEMIDLVTLRKAGSFTIEEGLDPTAWFKPFPVFDGEVYVSRDPLWPPVVTEDYVVSTSDFWTSYSLDDGLAGQVGQCEMGFVCGFDRGTRERLWIKSAQFMNTPMVVGDTMYAVTRTYTTFPKWPPGWVPSLCAYDVATGVERHCTTTAGGTQMLDTVGWRPIYSGGVLFVGAYDTFEADSVVRAFNATGGVGVDYFPGGGKYMAVANDTLVTTVPALRVTRFES